MHSVFTFVGVIVCFVVSFWFPWVVLAGVFGYFLGGLWWILFFPAMLVGLLVDIISKSTK